MRKTSKLDFFIALLTNKSEMCRIFDSTFRVVDYLWSTAVDCVSPGPETIPESVKDRGNQRRVRVSAEERGENLCLNGRDNVKQTRECLDSGSCSQIIEFQLWRRRDR